MKEKRCLNCIHFFTTDTEEERTRLFSGECRRFPPHYHAGAEWHHWPRVFENTDDKPRSRGKPFCGEFEAAK
jgi:hypothetical protein